MKRCPKCSRELGDGLREGQETVCPRCGLEIRIHYSLREQLSDPIGLLVRDPKYVSKRSQLGLIFVILFIVVLVGILITWRVL
jgi:DNA-directed RNA polymerase subunit RPC12/RpoP